MHWLSGSKDGDALNKLWWTVGALDDRVVIHNYEPFAEYDHSGTPVRFYRDINVTEKHLLELSPADAKEITKLCNHIRKLKNLSMPVTDLRGVKVTKKKRIPISLIFSALSAVRLMSAFSKVSRDEYIARFQHEGIRGMLRSFTTEKSGVVPLLFTMGFQARGDGGFPEGGSLPFVQRIVKTFTLSGGELLLNTRADKIIVEEGRAVGVMAGGKRLNADAVIVTADTMAIEHLFDVPLNAPWLEEMRKVCMPTMVSLISLGVNADLSKYSKNHVFKPGQPITLATEVFEHLALNNYAGDPVYSPEGKSALTIQLNGDTYDFWKKAKEEGRYAEEKQKIADAVIAALAEQFPETKDRIEVIDVATPLTYERYCGNWKGSWMTEMGPGSKMKNYPAVIKGLSGLYFAGQRMFPPGGLPPALTSGRIAVQYLCRDTGTVFVSEE